MLPFHLRRELFEIFIWILLLGDKVDQIPVHKEFILEFTLCGLESPYAGTKPCFILKDFGQFLRIETLHQVFCLQGFLAEAP